MNRQEATEKNYIISSLTLNTEENVNSDKLEKVVCLKCDLEFTFPEEEDEYLAHLFLIHRLVIADIEDIADLKEYLIFWSKELKEHGLEHFCTTMLLDQLPDGAPSKDEKYYLLSDILPKDLEIRKKLHISRLEKVLAQHQFERTDRTFCKECIHCRDIIKGTRSDFLEHLYNKHFVQLGKAENLVFIDELIDIVQSKLENLICLYCEKTFKDRCTLKEHMRKKGHKRINPDLKFYDKFFLINYKTEKPKRTKKFNKKSRETENDKTLANNFRNSTSNFNRKENNRNIIMSDDDADSDWSDWEEENRSIKCLFCAYKNSDFNNVKLHMLEEHYINFDELTSALNFYERVKIVNFVRRQVHILQCIDCKQRFNSHELFEEHLKANKHYTIGEKSQWDKAEFFFPTYEDDEMLCHLDDENADYGKTPVVIYSEETKDNANEEAEKLSLENFAHSVSKLF
ncbi:zinc finger protein 277 [Condylostylus longicornis]|uniref:zinc finger protein 277 n=1 Tax=Condylostylus longicornis TaxID=2530218 RepID=UPI00244E4A39|nr:zinc finger protein 277 [Condylostylus longicornis]